LVEDNVNDEMLLRRCFIRSHLTNPIYVVHSGEAAIDYLGHGGKYSKDPEPTSPSVIFLDVGLPGMDGFHVLKWIRTRPELAAMRIIVLTASDNMRDVKIAYELGANSFLVKPVDFERFTEFSQALGGYWQWNERGDSPVSPGSGVSTVLSGAS
jgi:CheY-like chemotaxis protein